MRSWSKIPWHPRDPPPNRSSLKIYITVVLFRHQIEFRSAVTSFLASYRVAGEIAEAPSIFVPGLQSQDSNPYPILFLANWSPGSPPLWSPPPLPLSSSNRHHRRRRRIRTYHQTTQVSAYLPFFASLRIMQPDYCFRSIRLLAYSTHSPIQILSFKPPTSPPTTERAQRTTQGSVVRWCGGAVVRRCGGDIPASCSRQQKKSTHDLGFSLRSPLKEARSGGILLL